MWGVEFFFSTFGTKKCYVEGVGIRGAGGDPSGGVVPMAVLVHEVGFPHTLHVLLLLDPDPVRGYKLRPEAKVLRRGGAQVDVVHVIVDHALGHMGALRS